MKKLIGCLIVVIFVGCGPKPLDMRGKFYAAKAAAETGDHAKARLLLDECLAEKPTAFAFLERARLALKLNDASQAISDCEAGLELQPDNIELQWLLGEAKKKRSDRFQGENAQSPSINR